MPSQNVPAESVPAVRLRLPATSANLGPGFDALGLALSLYLTVEARLSDRTEIQATGRDAPLTGALSNNLLLMTYEEVFRDLGLSAPTISLKLHNDIPLGMGCGSSAAAILAGVFLANHFGQLLWSPQQILDEASRREGHPDNVAACFYGGLTASASTRGWSADSATSTVAVTLGRNLKWKFMLALPAEKLSTSAARALLPFTYNRADAVANVQATALLVAAFALDRPDLLGAAMHDCLHQPFRAAACPLLPALLPLVGRYDIQGVALSGAGPAVLLIASPAAPFEPVEAAITAAAGTHLAEILRLQIGEGARLSTETR